MKKSSQNFKNISDMQNSYLNLINNFNKKSIDVKIYFKKINEYNFCIIFYKVFFKMFINLTIENYIKEYKNLEKLII